MWWKVGVWLESCNSLTALCSQYAATCEASCLVDVNLWVARVLEVDSPAVERHLKCSEMGATR